MNDNRPVFVDMYDLFHKTVMANAMATAREALLDRDADAGTDGDTAVYA